MLNKIINMCKEIYRDYTCAGRKNLVEDNIILDTIIRVYNTTEIDWEKVRFLWVNYLEKGNLYLSEAMEMARERIAYEEIKETERLLNAWLESGVY